MTSTSWQGVEVVDQVIALVEEPTADLSKKFEKHAAKFSKSLSWLHSEKSLMSIFPTTNRSWRHEQRRR